MGTGMIHQMHIMHTGGTSGHAGKAAETTIYMFNQIAARRCVFFQHILDLVYPPARAVQFVTKQGIGWAGGRTKTAMHTGP